MVQVIMVQVIVVQVDTMLNLNMGAVVQVWPMSSALQ
jgi:hypothetical protein